MGKHDKNAAELDAWLEDLHRDVLDTADQLRKMRRAVGRLLADRNPAGQCNWCGVKWIELKDGTRKPVTGGICTVCKPSFRNLVDRVDMWLSKGVHDGQ